MNSTINRSLDSFLKGEDQVVVIKGAWGIGKTYLWDSYIQNRITKNDGLTQIAYSYVSLFGKTSLADIRAAIFQSATPIISDKNIEARFNGRLLDSANPLKRWCVKCRLCLAKRGLFSKLSGVAKLFPNKFTGAIAAFEYYRIKNYIICFDDLERKGDSLSVGEIMGLTDELARRKNCKVILIFNDNSLLDIEEFKTYREKVVDNEFNHNPSHEQNLEYIFPTSDPLFEKLKNAIATVDLKNIRIIKKLKCLINGSPDLKNKNLDELIIGEFINHAVVLFWSYYSTSTALSFDFVKEQLEENTWSYYFGSIDNDLSEEEKKYQLIASKLRLSPSIFDKQIIHYLENGFMDIDDVKSSIETLSNRKEVLRVSEELSNVWKMYTDSFTCTNTEIINSFMNIISNNLEKIALNEFSSAIDMLSELGEDVTELLNEYVNKNQTELMADMNENASSLARMSHMVRYEPLLEKIKALQTTQNDQSIDQISMAIATTRVLDPRSIDFLCSFTPDMFVVWIKTNPKDLHIKLSGLLSLGDIVGSNEDDASRKYKQISQNVHSAIVQLASENELNKMRAKGIYKIDIEKKSS
ncbi:MAG: hypothetical protein G3I11_02885 [Ferrovum sp.]|nr:hypothetical protein [Ferrovum sp.]